MDGGNGQGNESIDYEEIFSPVAKMNSVRAIIAICAYNEWDVFQDDVPTAFLKGVLKEEVWMDQPPGFTKGNLKCRLKKALYGLKQAPREFKQLMHKYLSSKGFKNTSADACVYCKPTAGNGIILVGVYVDDILSTGTEIKYVQKFRAELIKDFKMETGGPLEFYLGIKVSKSSDGVVTLDQNEYLRQKCSKFSSFIGQGGHSSPLPHDYLKIIEKEKGQPESGFPYAEMVGSLMYAMVCTRPDIAMAMSVVDRYTHKPTAGSVQILKHLFRYVTCNSYSLQFHPCTNTERMVLTGWADASYCNQTNSKSTSGYCFKLGGSLISWASVRQDIVALSTAEAEYIAATCAGQETLWLKSLLNSLSEPQGNVTIFEDNQACILLSKNTQNHKRSKHINARYDWIRDHIRDGDFELVYCSTKSQLADCLTKSLPGVILRQQMARLGVTHSSHITVKEAIRQ